MIKTNLTFAALRKANTLRLPLFKNARGEPAHTQPDGSDWSLGEWMNAILGELGEAANLVKKIRRGDMPLSAVRGELANELADIVTYADITAMQLKNTVSPCNSFDELRRLLHSSSHWKQLSMGELMCRAFGEFGYAARLIDDRIDRPEMSIASPTIRDSIWHGVRTIDMVAYKIDVDLGTQVAAKFNTVSERVGANVFINAGGVVHGPQGIAL